MASSSVETSRQGAAGIDQCDERQLVLGFVDSRSSFVLLDFLRRRESPPAACRGQHWPKRRIDGSGRVLQVTKRMTKASLLAKPKADGRSGLVQQFGYPFAWLWLCSERDRVGQFATASPRGDSLMKK